jgi:diguanylate cyclase (GGDEF)-like protein
MTAESLPAAVADPLCQALLESRQRWRDLVAMAADIAFETDAEGRFTFVFPDPALGWAAGTLLGQPASLLLAGPGSNAGGNPFAPAEPLRDGRAWIRRGDGGTACLTFAAAPLFDVGGVPSGARGVAIDLSERDAAEARVAALLRRAELIDHILDRMRREVLAPKMIRAVLDALVNALGAEGAAIVRIGDGTPPGHEGPLHQAGGGALAVAPHVAALLREAARGSAAGIGADQRPLLASVCSVHAETVHGVGLWRTPGSRPWDSEDLMLLAGAAGVLRVVLEHERMQREMSLLARTDPLTGLLNRRSLDEEIRRQFDRLRREELPGTLIFVDLDNFKQLNDRLGHETGDEALRLCAALLREAVRPGDLVARLGGDEFAVFLYGADHLTGAERADMLCATARETFAPLGGEEQPPLSFSIGVATWWPATGEPLDSLKQRADKAMYRAKGAGRNTWKVAPALDGQP